MSNSHYEHPINETEQSIVLPTYTHPISHRHDFTPSIGKLYVDKVTDMFPGRHVAYGVNNVVEVMPLAGNMKQDFYMYTESVFCAWHAVWAKWPLFRYGKLSPLSDVEVPETVPYFTLYDILSVEDEVYGSNHVSFALAPGSLLDSLYGLTVLCKPISPGPYPYSTVGELLELFGTDTASFLHEPINGLYLRAWYHHWLINHTNEWLSAPRGKMINDEYPYRNDDFLSIEELRSIIFNTSAEIFTPGDNSDQILHERDYFTSANPMPQKGAAVATVSGQTVQDLTKAIHQQEILEKDADAGTSHYEAIVARYGVSPRSLGIMRPVSAAAPTRQVVSVNPIFNSAGDTVAPADSGENGVNFQGDITGRGFSADGSHQVDFTADVDGCLLTCSFIRQETIYHQGLNRMFKRLERNDFIDPATLTDGDEPIYNSELSYPLMRNAYAVDIVNGQKDRDMVFGYRNKAMDYLYQPSRVSGQFHTTMKHWSLHRDFAGRFSPALNDEFVRVFDTPDQIFTYTGQTSRVGYPQFIVYMQFVGQIHDCIPNYTKREI